MVRLQVRQSALLGHKERADGLTRFLYDVRERFCSCRKDRRKGKKNFGCLELCLYGRREEDPDPKMRSLCLMVSGAQASPTMEAGVGLAGQALT